MLLRILSLFALLLAVWLTPSLARPEPPNPVRLVAMIEGQTDTGSPVMGAGLVVGRLESGELVVVTAKHVVETLFSTNEFRVRFFDQPEKAVTGRILHKDFGRDLDLAVIAAGGTLSLQDLDFTDQLSVGRLREPVKTEERVSLIGQTEGTQWNATSRTQMVTGDQGNSVRINSPEAGPGVSGGVAVDTSDRIIGIALTDDKYVITVLKLSVIETQLRTVGVPFSLSHAEPKIISHQDYESGLRAAFRVSGANTLSNFPPNAATVPIVDILLDETETLKGFSRNMKGQAALSWLSNLITHGFDANRLVNLDTHKRPLLLAALQENNVALAVTLLDNGASPYLYEELWGEESMLPTFLFPLGVLQSTSLSDGDKKTLIKGMVRAGLTITERDTPERHHRSRQMEHVHRVQDAIGKQFSVAIPLQNEMTQLGNALICGRVRNDEYDWCGLLADLPSGFVIRHGGWHREFEAASLVKPLAILNGYLYVMTYSLGLGNAETGYGLMRVSKEANELIWYRYMGSGAGLGICEELRGGPRSNSYRPRDCWRRQVMVRSGHDGIYTVDGYDSVRYESIR